MAVVQSVGDWAENLRFKIRWRQNLWQQEVPGHLYSTAEVPFSKILNPLMLT